MCVRSSNTNFIFLPPNGSTIMRLRIWSMLRTVPPMSVTLLLGSGGTSSSGSLSDELLREAWLLCALVVARPVAGTGAGDAGCGCEACCCGERTLGSFAAGEEEELWDIITAGNNI